MKSIHLKYKQDTGNGNPVTEIQAEVSDHIPNHYLVEQDELRPFFCQRRIFKVYDPEYVEYLERREQELSDKLTLIKAEL
ncbi:hypothetical protein [Sunxiuqinia sp. sy24]|uniref:hypothetical protein n=1 Tax=Sunxiuqinia sp. sy24 TaxID=3461495 RepID=UPI0040468163